MTWPRHRVLHAQGRSRSRSSVTGSRRTARARWATTLNTVLRTATNPVLAHLFVNYLLDVPERADQHQLRTGTCSRSTTITPQRLVKEQILPPSLMSTAVLPSFFRRGVMELQIPVTTNLLWEQAWQVASNGRVAGWPSARSAPETAGGASGRTGCSGRAWPLPGHHLAHAAVHRALLRGAARSRPRRV